MGASFCMNIYLGTCQRKLNDEKNLCFSLFQLFQTGLNVSHFHSIENAFFLRAGQLFVLHPSVSVDGPTQSFPNPDGGGESQFRLLDLVPPPHVLLHDAHAPQLPHSPLTPNRIKRK